MSQFAKIPLANNKDEFSAFLMNGDSRFIRTLEDFDRWNSDLTSHEFIYDRKQILGAIDNAIVDQFRLSLLFKNGGLAHAQYDMLADHLTDDQFSRLWAMFGFSMRYFDDHKDMKCEGHGTCVNWQGSVCTSNC
jgi:hypothetical protein